MAEPIKRCLRFLAVTYLWVYLLPFGFQYLGLASNQFVLIVNGDKFPVLMTEREAAKRASDDGFLKDGLHCVMTRKTHLNFMADIFDLGDEVYSIGDVLIEIGRWLELFLPYIWGVLVVRKILEYEF